MSREVHVSIQGNDKSPGTQEQPFRTINHAAKTAQPGDVITVHEGTYREWVNPIRGGNSDTERITYQAAPGEKVVITGAEVIQSWEHVSGSVWKTVIPDSFFGEYHPYRETIYGDWFNDNGRVHHTGEVYLNGKSLYEMESLDKVMNPEIWELAQDAEGSKYTWYCENNDGNTTIWANFHGHDPAKNVIEINVRPFCFWSEKTGCNYITVRGFTMKQAATNWAPPTALQTGLIGPHWSKGWVIEHNVISDSRCSGISLGKEISTGHNLWTNNKSKHGTQHERDVIFRALHSAGWTKENVGSHIVRYNTIFDCGQTGICGHLGGAFCEITDNHIYNIHTKRLFDGPEIAGIKLHAPIDTILQNNHIHNTFRGIWMDWQAQGTRISENLLYDNDKEDLFVEVSHGPYVVDNNVMLSDINLRNFAQGGTYAHNLFTGNSFFEPTTDRYTPYHFPHETAVAGLMTVSGGDDRFYNNIFVGIGVGVTKEYKYEVSKEVNGLSLYDDGYPLPGEEWWAGKWDTGDQAALKMPSFFVGNVFLNGAVPCKQETDATVFPEIDPKIKLVHEDGKAVLHMELDDVCGGVKTQLIETKMLGKTFVSELPYENNDGTPLCIDIDFFGNKRNVKCPGVGPFEAVTNRLEMETDG